MQVEEIYLPVNVLISKIDPFTALFFCFFFGHPCINRSIITVNYEMSPAHGREMCYFVATGELNLKADNCVIRIISFWITTEQII